jgi:hypothetical protein
MTKKVLLIGWDAADWKTIDRLVDQGDMPITKGLMERGSRPPGRQRRRAGNRLQSFLTPASVVNGPRMPVLIGESDACAEFRTPGGWTAHHAVFAAFVAGFLHFVA